MDLHALGIRSVLGPLWARWERSPYLAHYRRLRRTQYDPPDTVRALQWDAVLAQVRHAAATVPFYRSRFADAGLCPEDVRTPEDYLRLPLLTKADLRSHGADLRSTALEGASLHRKETSGSTGVSVTVFVDEA